MRLSSTRTLALAVLALGVGALLWSLLRSDEARPSVAEIRAAARVDVSPADTGSLPDTGSPDPASTDPVSSGSAPAPDPIPVLGDADTLTGLDGWLNTDATSLEEIRAGSELTVVQFWTFGCRNCKNTLPALQDIYAEFGDRIEIVGVHAPEFGFEADVDNIVEAARDLGVTWPIALDTDKRNFHRWQEGPTAYWPRVYLIDGDNQIRLDQRGDGIEHYLRLADYIERLLADGA